jgi:hypothetical protein
MPPLKSNEIGRIWIWQSTFAKKKDQKPDVVLPDGFLFEGKVELTYKHVCTKRNLIASLPNQDLVLGPPMENTPGIEDQKEREHQSAIRKQFFSDMIYLWHAIEHGTIALEDFPLMPSTEVYK